MQNLQRLYQCLLAGDEAGVKEQAGIIFEDLDEGNSRYICGGFCTALYLAGRECNVLFLTPLYDGSQPLAEQKAQLEAAAIDFCAEVNDQKRSRNEDRKQMILEYIQNNYTDSELYAAAIAEHVGISEKYLYSFVKEQTGMSVGAYLMSLRMKKAAELLATGDTPVKEVCRMVGFNSENSFYKAFKRTFGVTPSQYRETAGH